MVLVTPRRPFDSGLVLGSRVVIGFRSKRGLTEREGQMCVWKR